MTFLAKTFGPENAVRLGIGVTVNAIFQTEISRPDSFSDGLITMMQYELKMLVTHDAFVTNAFITPGDDFAMRTERSGFGFFVTVSKQASCDQEACSDYGKSNCF